VRSRTGQLEEHPAQGGGDCVRLCPPPTGSCPFENWAADVQKYSSNADPSAIAGIARYCGISLQKRDSSLVALSHKEELARVRENFLKKKLGLSDADADTDLDKAIISVGEKMKGDRTKNRVTVYYLLAEHFGKLSLFSGPNPTSGKI
jgi:hypothetical protein